MKVLRVFVEIIRFVIRIILLPIQITLSILIYMIDFTGGVFSFISGIIGTVIILGGICGLFMPPIDWRLFWAAMIIGSLIGVLPGIVAEFGDAILMAIKYILAQI